MLAQARVPVQSLPHLKSRSVLQQRHVLSGKIRRRTAPCCRCEQARTTVPPAQEPKRVKEVGDDMGFVDLIHVRSGRWLRPLQRIVVAILLLALPVAASPGNAAPSAAADTHVYLLRGVLNIFSLGLDDIGAKLQAQGFKVTVANYLSWSSLADEAAAEYRSGRTKTIVLVGHSSGATALPDMVARLDRLGAPVKLAIGLDSVFRTSLAGRVGRYINFYVANGNGEPVAKTRQFHGELDNIDVGRIGMAHLTIDKSEIMQRKVISAIDAVTFGGTRVTPGAQTPRPEAHAAKPARSAARAATARN